MEFCAVLLNILRIVELRVPPHPLEVYILLPFGLCSPGQLHYTSPPAMPLVVSRR
jgi:hypothetical protein